MAHRCLAAGWIAAVLPATACGGTGDAARSPAVVTDSAGVILIHNVGGGMLSAGEPAVTEDLRIGAVEGEEPYQFFQVYDLAVDDASGEIYVGNNQTGTVRVFSGEGEFLREFGGVGRGPGEVQSIREVWFAGDRVVVTDNMWGAGQTVLYTKAGEFVTSWRQVQPDRSRIVPSMHRPQEWLGYYYDGKPYPRPAPGEPSPRPRAIHLLFPDSGAAGEVVYSLPDDRLFGTTTHGVDWPLFEPTPGFGMDGAGNFYLSRGYPYRIEVYDPDGRLVRGVSREYDPIPISDADIDELKTMVSAVYDTMNTRSSPNEQRRRILERVDEQATFPRVSFRAPLRELLVARDGAFWVERADAATPAQLEYEKYYGYINRATGRSTRWDLFDGEGRFLGFVELPPTFNPMHVTERTVTGVLKDELDVEYVVRFRVGP